MRQWVGSNPFNYHRVLVYNPFRLCPHVKILINPLACLIHSDRNHPSQRFRLRTMTDHDLVV